MDQNRWGIFGGAALIVLGALILVGQFLSINIWSWIWPFFIIGVGAAFFMGMIAGGRSMGALAVPGSVLTTIGLMLFFQNLFGVWGTWAYSWTLIIAGAGVGLFIFGRWSNLPDLSQVGRVIIVVGLVLFLVFGMFFELGASLLGFRSLGGVLWPILLILAGLYVLVGRPLLDRSAGPVSRSVMAFDHSVTAAGSTPSVIDASFSGATASTESQPVSNQVPLGSAIRRVHFAAVGDLTIAQGEQERLEIEASDLARERIRTEVRGDTLYIRHDGDWWKWLDPRTWNVGPIRYTLILRELEGLEDSGVGQIVVNNLITRRLDIRHSGAGSLALRQLTADEVTVNQSGVGSIEADGRVERQSIDLSGAGSYKAPRLTSQTARVQLSGVGSTTIAVAETLDVQLSGTGSVEYYGNPRLSQRVSGVGSVRRVG